jgi:hypothetical protein
LQQTAQPVSIESVEITTIGSGSQTEEALPQDITSPKTQENSNPNQSPVFDETEDEYQNSIANNILNKATQTFPAESAFSFPEHGPRKKRELDEENEIVNEIQEKDSVAQTPDGLEIKDIAKDTEEITEKAPEVNNDNGLVSTVRRIFELKLKTAMGVFQLLQEYLRGVESRMRNSDIFNPNRKSFIKPIKRENN